MADTGEARKAATGEADAWRPAVDGAESRPLPAETVLRRPAVATRLRLAAGRVLPRRRSLGQALAEERAYGHFFLFVPVFLGIGAALWFAAESEPPLAPLVLLAVAALWPAWRLGHREDGLALAAGALFLVPAGMVLAALESARLDTVILDSPVTTHVTGRVLSHESDDRDVIRYRVAIESTREPALKRPPQVVTLVARSRHAPIGIGGGIAGRARLSPPSGPALAGLNDFAFDAYFAGTGAVGFFYGAPTAVTAADAAGAGERIRAQIAEWRSRLTAHIRGRIGGDAGAIAAALVTAEQRAISPATVEALRQAGLAHVLAISGLNMVLAAGTFLVGARMLMALVPGFCERYPAKKIAAAGALAMVTLYILVSGGAISAVRSWIMIVIMLVAVIFGRTAISLRNVALSAILILAGTPSAVTGPGFQMSYAATLGLVAGYALLRERPARPEAAKSVLGRAGGGLGRFMRDLVLSSLIGSLATLIYSIGHFHRIPAYGLAGNLLAMPVIGFVVMPFGLLAVLLMPFGLDAVPFAVMGYGIKAMIALAAWVSGWQGEILTGRIPAGAFLAIALGGGLVSILRTGLRHVGTLLVLAGTAATLLPDGIRPPEILVSEDGRLVAVLRDGTAISNRARPPDFVYGQWRGALALGDHLGPQIRRTPGLMPEKATAPIDAQTKSASRIRVDRDKAKEALAAAFAAAAGEGRFVCETKAFCAVLSPSGWRIVTVEEPAFLGPACDSADLVVVPIPLRLDTCRSGARLVTARHLRKSGALEIRTGATAAFSEARITQAVTALQRPWARHRTYDWRTGRFETGPDDQL